MADVSLASLALRLAVSMGVVIGLMFVAAKLLRRAQAFAYGNGMGSGKDAKSGPAGKSGKGGRRRRGRVTTIPIAVTTIAPLTRSASVAIVRASGRELVLGVTESHVTLLHSSLEARDDLDGHDIDGLDDIDLDHELEDLVRESATSTAAARIAAADSGTPERGAGLPAWTDALETLRAMTVRR